MSDLEEVEYQIDESTYSMEEEYGSKFRKYLDDQIDDGFGGGEDDSYLSFLRDNLIPGGIDPIDASPRCQCCRRPQPIKGNTDLSLRDAKIIDIGTRQFDTYDWFLERYDNKIDGIDVCKVALQKAKVDGKPLREMDAHAIHKYIEPETYDLIISFHAFEHMYDLPRVLRNCAMILKPRGYLYFALPMPSHNWGRGHYLDMPNNRTMWQTLAKAGFEQKYDLLSRHGKFRAGQEIIGLARKI